MPRPTDDLDRSCSADDDEANTTLGVDDLPVFLTEVELADPLQALTAPPIDGVPSKKMRALVRLRHQPIGYVVLPAPSVSVAELAAAIDKQLDGQIKAHLVALGEVVPDVLPLDGFGPGTALPPVELPFMSVVVATKNRPEKIGVVLETLMVLDYPSFEVVVVENGATDGRTSAVVAGMHDDRVRYVHEPIAGVSRGRNRGVREATGEIVVFVDDDVRVDTWLLRAVAQGFARAENVGCVTGLVSSMYLNTIAELYVDQRLTWAESLQPRVFDLTEHRDDSPLYPYSAGIFGTGANFAIKREVFDRIGEFDEALGGSPVVGGEDLDIFFRVVNAGYALVREPAAIVHHAHYNDLSVLRRQMFNYGRGFTAYLMKHLLRPRTAVDIVSRVPRGVGRISKAKKGAESLAIVPPEIVGREFRGMLLGPFAYIKSSYRLRRARRAGDMK